MPDLPDWYQGFQLVGSDITINVNIEASDVTLPISIDAVTVTLDVNLESQDANIDFNFADQAVAVFDASKWFARQGAQISVTGSASVSANADTSVLTRVVPTGKRFNILGMGYRINDSDMPEAMSTRLLIAGASALETGSHRGDGVTLDVPVVATAGQTVALYIGQYGVAATVDVRASLWGYDDDE